MNQKTYKPPQMSPVSFEVSGIRLHPYMQDFIKVGDNDFRCLYQFQGGYGVMSRLSAKYPSGILVRVHKHQGKPVMSLLTEDDTIINRIILKEAVLAQFERAFFDA